MRRIGIWLIRVALIAVVVGTGGAARGEDGVSELMSDEQVVFFPTVARWIPEDGQWEARVHAWVFEPEEDALSGRLLAQLLGQSLKAETEEQQRRMRERLRPFLVDNERGKRLVVRVGDQRYSLPPTMADGQTTALMRFSPKAVETSPRDGLWEVRAVLMEGDDREFAGRIIPVATRGVSVISDIDDTIKETQVLDKSAVLRNTFLQPFRAVPGMADVYRSWNEQAGVSWHFVSASPWQLFEPLDQLTRDEKFPVGSFHLRPVQLLDAHLLQTLGDSRDFKQSTIAGLIEFFPERDFVLVGDNGEKDPEVYGEIARRFPQRVRAIYLRDVRGETRDDSRYSMAMRDVPEMRWMLFRDPKELPRSLDR